MDLADIVHAIKSEKELKQPLLKMLALEPVERNDALKKLAFHMKSQGAPQGLVDSILQLQSSPIAKEVMQQL